MNDESWGYHVVMIIWSEHWTGYGGLRAISTAFANSQPQKLGT